MHSSENLSIGCIGCGNMGGAILGGLAERTPHTLYGYNRTRERLRPLVAKGVKAVADIASLVRGSEIIIVAVKPWLVEDTLRQMLPHLNKDKLVISVAAGITMSALHDAVEGICPVVRCMPNTPALVGAGVFALCLEDPTLKAAQKELLMKLFTPIGMALEMPEKHFTAFSAVVGAGPAYVFHFMNAVVQAGVTLGFPRQEAVRMVQALFDGSVRMAAASEHSLTDLRDQVCSPGGLTIAAINHLDRTAVRGHIIDAIIAADKKGREMED